MLEHKTHLTQALNFVPFVKTNSWYFIQEYPLKSSTINNNTIIQLFIPLAGFGKQ